MISRIAVFIFVITLGFYIFLFLFGWLNSNVDSYFYWAIGEYFRTGHYPFTAPFIYTKPTTISPPLYGVFFILTNSIPRADIILHALQLGLLATTSMLLYKMLSRHLQKSWALIVSCLFALYPVNLIYASSVLTENPAQFLVALWTYLVLKGIVSNKPRPLALAVLVGSIAGLMKYNLAIYMVLAGIFLLPFRKKIKLLDWIFPTLAAAILGVWILINYLVTGVWGLYDTHGTQLYNQFVAKTKILPPENHPAVIRMRSLLPPGADIAVPYWDIQEQLGNSLHGVWKDIDKTLFDVAWASVTLHPDKYLANSVINFARMHYDTLPHWQNIENMERTDTYGTDIPYCSALGTVQMCTPIIMTTRSYPVWNELIRIEIKLFQMLAPLVFYFLLLPALAVSLLWGTKLSRIYTVMYLTGVVPIAFTIHVDPRYVLPFYPLATLIIVASVQIVLNKIKQAQPQSPKQSNFRLSGLKYR